jgi:hypothetical protein
MSLQQDAYLARRAAGSSEFVPINQKAREDQAFKERVGDVLETVVGKMREDGHDVTLHRSH